MMDSIDVKDDEVHLVHLIYEIIKSYPAWTGCAAMTKLIMAVMSDGAVDKSGFLDTMSKCWDRTYGAAA